MRLHLNAKILMGAEVAMTMNPSETQTKLIDYLPAMVILLVDDDFLFRSAIRGILQKEGFQTIEAGDGIEGYNIIKEIGVSIVCCLPMSGCLGWMGFRLRNR